MGCFGLQERGCSCRASCSNPPLVALQPAALGAAAPAHLLVRPDQPVPYPSSTQALATPGPWWQQQSSTLRTMLLGMVCGGRCSSARPPVFATCCSPRRCAQASCCWAGVAGALMHPLTWLDGGGELRGRQPRCSCCVRPTGQVGPRDYRGAPRCWYELVYRLLCSILRGRTGVLRRCLRR